MKTKFHVGDILYDVSWYKYCFGVVVEVCEEMQLISVVWFENPDIKLYCNVYMDSNVRWKEEYEKAVKHNVE